MSYPFNVERISFKYTTNKISNEHTNTQRPINACFRCPDVLNLLLFGATLSILSLKSEKGKQKKKNILIIILHLEEKKYKVKSKIFSNLSIHTSNIYHRS